MTQTEAMTVDMLAALVATLTGKVNALTQEVENLKKTISLDGVYLDGVPDYVKDYINEQGKE
jgi:hypothetical protein